MSSYDEIVTYVDKAIYVDISNPDRAPKALLDEISGLILYPFIRGTLYTSEPYFDKRRGQCPGIWRLWGCYMGAGEQHTLAGKFFPKQTFP